uniref:OBG-type G domain-containing protein n=1 Tax=Strigamia maritima TaxID=126957 RepID=T1JHZ1_STRMM
MNIRFLLRYNNSFVILRKFSSANCREQTSSETLNVLRSKKSKSKFDRFKNFIDWRRAQVSGGRGGDGACSFMHLWCNANAGPDGGDGGNGGHVIFKACSQITSLAHIESIYRGLPGEKGYSKDCHGKSAEHTIIQVPIGTTFKSTEGKLVNDLDDEGQIFVAARGGAGGKGNHFFLSNEVRAPLVSEMGAEGEAHTYVIELKTIADVGLIGFPNAGKSTLLRAISRAKPKVAAYPFTTLKPHIGVVHFDNHGQLFVADIPGIIPGAHKNKGLGISFLRHIERCVSLVYVLDLSIPKPWIQLEILKYELEKYREGLSERLHIVVANKVDLPEAEKNFSEMRDCTSLPVIAISAKKGNKMMELMTLLKDIYIHKEKQENEKLYDQ